MVIPVRNRSHIISRAVDSVLAQTFTSWQLIIVDDGSERDDFLRLKEVISNYNDSRITLIDYLPAKNAAFARNYGAKLATGEWLCFLDSDDYYSKNKLHELNIHISKKEKSKAKNTLYYSQMKHDEAGVIKPEKGLTKNEALTDYLFLNNGLMQTSTLVMHHSLFAKVKFDSNLPKHQDYDLVLRLMQSGADFEFIPKCLAYWGEDVVAGHLGKKITPEYSMDWVENRASFFGDRAKSEFVYAHILSPMARKSKLQTIRLLIEAKRKDLVDIRTQCKTITLLVLMNLRLRS